LEDKKKKETTEKYKSNLKDVIGDSNVEVEEEVAAS